jgi:hypothetical protein
VEQTIIIKTKCHKMQSIGISSGASFQFSLNKPGKLLGVIELDSLPEVSETLLSNIGVSFGIGIAANLFRSDPKITSIKLQIKNILHPEWETITDLFYQMSGKPIVLQGNITKCVPIPAVTGSVFLLSGGKDTLYSILRAQKSRTCEWRPGLYLGAGCELNWRKEFHQVASIAKHFQLQLHHIRLYQMLVSSKIALRFGNRAVWRELVTINLARCYGDHIFTGINNDAIAQLKVANSHHVDFLSQLLPTLQALRKILNAQIETIPGEFEVYQKIRDHPLFNISGSCLTPVCEHQNLCAKCRTFQIYDKILAGLPLNNNDFEFIHGDHYLGDACLLAEYPQKTIKTQKGGTKNATNFNTHKKRIFSTQPVLSGCRVWRCK